MFTLHISKKYNIKLTIQAPYLDADELLIGQVLEYQDPRDKEPCWFGFKAKYLKDFDYRLKEDGRDSLTELLNYIKSAARELVRRGFVPDNAKLLFSMLPVEDVF
jgi:hypothetical protein